MSTPDLRARLAVIESHVHACRARRAEGRRAARAARDKARTSTNTAEALAAARDLLVRLAEQQQDVIRRRVERTVEAAVRAVFGPLLRFRFDVAVKRGVVSMEPRVGYAVRVTGSGPALRPAEVHWHSVDAVGGGVVDVMAFALRVAVLLMRKDARPVLVLDEPFKHVSTAHLPAVAAMTARVCATTGLQIIVISHEPELAAVADKVYEVRQETPGASKLRVARDGPAGEGQDD